MTNAPFRVELDCGHVMHYPDPLPALDSIVYCALCANYRNVTGYPHPTLNGIGVSWMATEGRVGHWQCYCYQCPWRLHVKGTEHDATQACEQHTNIHHQTPQLVERPIQYA